MSDSRPSQDIAHGVPPVAMSSTSTLVNKTGSWKYIRPLYEDKVAPCNHGCPVGIDIEGYMNLLREGKVEEARDLLLRENPLPAITGRVCYHPCEETCNRRQFDEGVAIHAVERMLGDLALEDAVSLPPLRQRKEKVAVVGAGPAGLACASMLARLGYQVTVYESDPEPGGILRYGIPEYRLPKKVVAGEIDRIRRQGVEFRCGVRLGKDEPWSVLDGFDAAFVATGVHKSKSLGLKGTERVCGVRPGLEFLRDVNTGGRPDLGRRVVVVGGGNTAMDCARTALRMGAETLVLYRRSRQEMPANAAEVEEAIKEGVKFEFLAAPVGMKSEECCPDDEPLEAIRALFNETEPARPVQKLTALECLRMKLGEPDKSGRRRPEPIPGSEFVVPADTVLTALGEDPEFDTLPGEIKRDEWVLKVDELGATTRPNLFAGGDIIDVPHTVAYAIGSGKRAAVGIDLRLSGGPEAMEAWVRGAGAAGNVAGAGQATPAGEQPDAAPSTDGLKTLRYGETGNISMIRWTGADPVPRHGPVNKVVVFDQININHFIHSVRHADREHAPAATGSFAETNTGLERQAAVAEAERCLNCGVCNTCELCLIFCPDVAISRRPDGQGFDINYDYCKGCGVCSAECPRGAIVMTREGL